MVNYTSSELNRTFAALADPTRRAILQRLAAGPRGAGQLAEPFAISLPAISKHLRVLESAGLLTRHRQGREHILELEAEPLRNAVKWMERYRRFWAGSLEGLANYLEQNNQPKKGRK